MGLLAKLLKAGRTLGGRDALWAHALIQGVAPGLEHVTLLCRLRPLVVVDIGANRGQFTLAVRHASPAALVWAFEPLPQAAAIFRKLFVKDDNVRLFPVAVGRDAGEAIIHVSARDDSSSLLPITTRQDELFPGTAEASTQTVRVVRLGDCLNAENLHAPALLKLDVQGFELGTLQGCESLLHKFSWVYVECSFVELYVGQVLADEVIAWLRERRFVVMGVYNMTYDAQGRAIQADFLFEQKPSPAG
jgi:FkbM family methyltransferase